MATYFHGVPEIQGDRLQTLHLMDPSYAGYSEAVAQANTVFQQQSQQCLVGVPVARQSGLSLSLSLTGSKYLKATQQLLDELVNVGKDDRTRKRKHAKRPTKEGADGSVGVGVGIGVEFTTAERQELVSMLDQVEQRYRQYLHQMQTVASTFEWAVGSGSTRSYTALALRTVSRQFQCLRDAISSQIRSAGKEDRLAGEDKSVGSRLRFTDNHLRQQSAIQQLGVAHCNAWRPHRGLPERAVGMLRAWLFEHFLHPYPKDRDKHKLAKETGLTRSQVSNWFINARVRLWKPMIEEMYLEDSKEQEHDDANVKTRKSDDSEQSAPRFTPNDVQSTMRTDRTDSFRPNQNTRPTAFDESFIQQYRQDDMSNRELTMKFGAYQIGGAGHFGREEFTPRHGGNSVSLTLGLPHCELQTPYLSSEGIAIGKRLDMGSMESNYFSLNNSNGSCYQTM